MRYLLLVVFGLMLSTVWAQFPPLEISADDVLTVSPASVEVPIRAGTNWQNITQITGTITFDTTIVTYDQVSYWGLSNPGGMNFTYMGGGVLTYTWSSLITVGPTLSAGAIVFTLKFNAIGTVGDVSPITFTNIPQDTYWANGFGWSGDNYTQTMGSVEISCPLMNGGYTSNLTSNTACFTDTTNYAISWAWDFGDGNTSTQQNPCHTYASPGNYATCMIVSDTCTSDTICTNVYICGPPSADWTSNTTGLVGSFTDASTNIPTTWLWDFGDGTTSTSENPNHLFPSEGTYTVCLSITNPCGSDSTCYSVTITCPNPTAAWTETSTDLSASFTDQSADAIGWSWDFGDGTSSSLQNPTHLYANAGTYTVCQIATSQCGSDTVCQAVTVTCAAPGADWSSVTQDLTVSFADMSSQSPTAWSWDFGDGNSSTMQSPSHTYATGGTYSVCLIASSNCGSDTTCYMIDVICDVPVASFSFSYGGSGDVSFFDQSTSSTSWFWDFGDGSTSTDENPDHTFASTATYTVCLIVTNLCGSDSVCIDVPVEVTGISEGTLSTTILYPNPVEDLLTINLSNEQGEYEISIYDINMRLIETHRSAGDIAINTRKLSQGVYIVRISTGGNQLVRQFVKK